MDSSANFKEIEPLENSSFIKVYEWEKWEKGDLTKWRIWFGDRLHYPIYISAIYLITIYSIILFMKNRKPFVLRKQLLFWNLGLSIFSMIGVYRLIPEFVNNVYQKDGIYKSICYNLGDKELGPHTYTATTWALLFVLSKIAELGDTLFIVARKKPLIFLHWYHHISVMAYCWYTMYSYAPLGYWFTIINYFVHSVMYFYFSLQSAQIKSINVKSISKSITILQLSQMVIGIWLNVYALINKLRGFECVTTYTNINGALVLYASYFVLFGIFFKNAYIEKDKNKKIN